MRQNTKDEGQKKGSRRRRTADGRDKPMRENRNMKDNRRGGVGGQPTGQLTHSRRLPWRRRMAFHRRRMIHEQQPTRAGEGADALNPSSRRRKT